MLVSFLRHAQSEANVFQNLDTRDSALTSHGIQQATRLTGHYDVVFCSPLRRTRATLDHSNITYNELIVAPEAREVRYHVSDLLADDPEPDDFTESTEEIANRCKALYKRIRAVNSDGEKSVLVVSHCNFIIEFTDRYARRRLNLANASIENEIVLFKSSPLQHSNGD